jgi:hypothetical protein
VEFIDYEQYSIDEEIEMIDKASSQACMKHYSRIFISSLMETMKNLLQENWYSTHIRTLCFMTMK